MSERAAFVKALEDNEDDLTTRLVFADWLDDHGEHEEADRHRKWPAAKKWLVEFCQEHNPSDEEDLEEDEYREWVIGYADLLEIGREAAEGIDGISCGNNMGMADALNEHNDEFWKNWSIVTGVPGPEDEERGYFSCAC